MDISRRSSLFAGSRRTESIRRRVASPWRAARTPTSRSCAPTSSRPPAGLPEFDSITCVEVIEHVYAPRDVLRTLVTLLKPGGSLVVSTPYHGYLKNAAVALSGRFDHHFDPLWDDGHIKFFSRRTLAAALHDAGLVGIRISGVGQLPYLWKSMLATARKPSATGTAAESS